MLGLENIFGSLKDRLLRKLAPTLRLYLAHTPLIWGDPTRVTIGRNVHLVDVLINVRSGNVAIEDDVFFGHGVLLLTGAHDLNKRGAERHASVPGTGRDIVIRKGAWIASHVIVIGPCEIGENAVLGAGSVVSGRIEADALYGGNPARRLRAIAFDS
jgi:acetyltransferase-like isoleucine patch superfamily enzyme